MNRLIFLILPVIIAQNASASVQDEYPENRLAGSGNTDVNFFVRSGAYFSQNEISSRVTIPTAYSDISIRIAHDNMRNVKIYSDMRLRYGTEFDEPVERGEIRELYIKLNGSAWEISAGKQIIKWGRSDFSSANSKLASRDPLVRSPDFEDMDLGNIIVDMKWSPLPFLTLELAGTPVYRPSVMITKVIEIPDYVEFKEPGSLMGGKGMQSYGLRVNLNTDNAVINFSWFDGLEPLPGIALEAIKIDTSQVIPILNVALKPTPYRIKNLGIDIETIIGRHVLRGELTYLNAGGNNNLEYVAKDELTWTAGFDFTRADWRITAEYSGKFVPDYVQPLTDPIIGSDPDPGQIALLLSVPGFDPVDYLRMQIASFNMLYTYQQHKFNHTGGLSIEREILFGRLIPSVKTLYNFTTSELALTGEIRYKPADGLTLATGGEYYYGRDGSIHDIISGFMNCVRISARYDF